MAIIILKILVAIIVTLAVVINAIIFDIIKIKQ